MKLIILLTFTSLIFSHPSTIQAQPLDRWTELRDATGIDHSFSDDPLIEVLFSNLLPIIIIIGGLLLLTMLMAGGFSLLINAQNPQGQEKGKQQITWAIVGFLLLFSAYWIMQILEIVFGISVL